MKEILGHKSVVTTLGYARTANARDSTVVKEYQMAITNEKDKTMNSLPVIRIYRKASYRINKQTKAHKSVNKEPLCPFYPLH